LAVNEIVPPAYVKEVGDEKFAAAPVGTGPFKFSNSENSGSRVVLEKNDDYWGGAPRISRLVFDTIPEVSSRIAALQSGTVDIATNIPPDLAETLGGATKAASINGTRIAFLAMNVTKAPFNDVKVRKAMNQAIDKKAIVDGLYLGYANTVNQPAFPEMVGYSESFKGYEYNVDSASAVLSRTTAPITIDVKEENRVLAEAIVGQLQAAGVDAKVRVLEALAFDGSIRSGASQAYINTWGVSEGDADVIFARHFWSEGRTASFDTGYSNPDVDKLIIAGRSTLDVNQRKDIYAQATKLVMDDAPWVPLFTAEEIYGVSTKVDGWKPSPIGRIDVKTVNIK
jgi:peptide/nickel transport system substrate-binding protein